MSGPTLTKDVLTDFGYAIRSEEIDLSNQNISDIDIDAFEEYEQVTKINLSGNQIEFVDRGTFAQNAKLRDLILANNKLRSFSAEVFRAGAGVENIDLSGNPLETFDVSITETLCLQSLNLENTGVVSRVQLTRVGRCLHATWV
jgi:Leucine-rich repeat (LRR) protein